MKNHKAICLVVAVVWSSSSVVTGSAGSDLPHTSAQVRAEGGTNTLAQLRQVVTSGGVTGLIAHVSVNVVAAPRIYSQWYVDRLGTNDPERVAQEMGRREFGLELAKALEVEARRVRDLNGIEERSQAVEGLLALEHWIAQSEGYGNEWLSYRCQDIAGIPLAYLVADMACPTQHIDRLFRLFPPVEVTGPRRVRVLNGEIGREVFPFTVDGKPVTTEFLQSKWDEMIQPFFKALEPLSKQLEDRSAPPVSGEYLHEIMAKVPRSASDLPREWQFLWDDQRIDDLSTVVGRWSMKSHKWLTVLRTSRHRRYAGALYEFRQRVGPYPIKPPVPDTEAGERSVRHAFAAVADQMYMQDPIHVPPDTYGSAASVFWRILNRKYMDEDGWTSALYEQKQQREQKIEKEKRLRAEALAARTNTVPASTTSTNAPTKPRKPILEPPPPPTKSK